MVNKKFLILFLAIFLGLVSLNFVSAATTMHVPVTETNYTTITFNCTTTTTDCDECLNATIWYNSTGGVPNTILGAIVNDTADDIHFNGSISIEDLDDALTYNFTCAMWNATGNVINSSAVANVGIDNTAPTSVTLTKSSSTTTSLTISISVVDALTGIASSCTVVGSGTKSISDTGTSQTLTVTGLNCGTSHSYKVTCSDRVGNSKVSSLTSFSTDACAGAGLTTTPVWTHTYVPSDEQVEEGYTRALSIKNRVKVKVGTNYHYVGVVSATVDKATIEISSDPVQVTIGVGEDAKVDVTDDGFYDVYVLLNDIVDSKADVTIQKIHEEIPEGQGKVTTTGEITDGEIEEDGEEERDLIWLWVLIAVVVLAAIIGIVAKKKRK